MKEEDNQRKSEKDEKVGFFQTTLNNLAWYSCLFRKQNSTFSFANSIVCLLNEYKSV